MEGVHGVTGVVRDAYLWAMRTPLILLPLLVLGPLRAAAQPVLGVVVEEGRGAPVAGAMVLLFDDDGNRVDRMLSNAAGRFLLEARGRGPHYIVVDRIGYASVTTDRFDPAEGAGPMRIEAPIDPIRLRELVITGDRCRVRPGEGEAAARVWEEARKALAAEEWTREAGRYRYTLLRFEQVMDREAVEVLSETTMAMPDQVSAFDTRVRVRWPTAAGYAGTPLAAPVGPGGEAGNGWEHGRDGDFVTAATTTDARGYFLLCDVPFGLRLRVAVSDPNGAEPPADRIFLVSPDQLAIIESIRPAGHP